MPATAINTSATKKYVLEDETAVDGKGNPLPEATVWELGAMDSYVQAHCTSKATKYSIKEGATADDLKGEDASSNMEYNMDAQTLFLEVCKFCIKGWVNFKDAHGNDIEFKTAKTNVNGKMYTVVHPDLMVMIPIDIIQELYVEIDNLSTLSEEDSKNSSTGS